jgi:hypothetical protein
MPTEDELPEISIMAWDRRVLTGEWMVSISLGGKEWAAMTLPVEAPIGIATRSNLIRFLRDLASMIEDDLNADIGEPAGDSQN